MSRQPKRFRKLSRPVFSVYGDNVNFQNMVAGLVANADPTTIASCVHPCYNAFELQKYRDTFEGGDEYIEKYLRKRYQEDPGVWIDRKALTYNPKHATAALEELGRGIAQRSSTVKRSGGSKEYAKLCRGENHGVDGNDSTMNSFMAVQVIPEMLALGHVGIYCDRAPIREGATLGEIANKLPYYYIYRAEDIRNWCYSGKELTHLLLRECQTTYDQRGFPAGHSIVYRQLELITIPSQTSAPAKKFVRITFYSFKNEIMGTPTDLDIPEIPFTFAKLPNSLLKDIANHQAALLNLSSADIYYAWSSNAPFYIEQYDPLDFKRFKEIRSRAEDSPLTSPTGTTADSAAAIQAILGENVPYEPPQPASREESARDRQFGTIHGMRYPRNTDAPQFIHPSPEPLQASMEKQEQLKREIRHILMLAVTNLDPKLASAESKAHDQKGVEAGMAFIGMVLQGAENSMSRHWHNYLRETPAIAVYPDSYSLKSDEERRKEAEDLKKLQFAAPSLKYNKEISKRIARILFEGTILGDSLDQIYTEIMASETATADPEILIDCRDAGFVSDATASVACGFKEGEAQKAADDHAARLARIAAHQTNGQGPAGAGVGDLNADPKASSKEKEGKPKRGEGAKAPQGEK